MNDKLYYGVNDSWADFLIRFAVAAIAVGAILGVWIGTSHYEAKAFERATGKQVSTWDAMWLDLRVQEGISHERVDRDE